MLIQLTNQHLQLLAAFAANVGLAYLAGGHLDYFDTGARGLYAIVLFGFLSFWIAGRFWRLSRPCFSALMSVLPWSLGSAGLAYVGFFFIPLEVLASAGILGVLGDYRGPLQRVVIAGAARGAAFLPFFVAPVLRSLAQL